MKSMKTMSLEILNSFKYSERYSFSKIENTISHLSSMEKNCHKKSVDTIRG